MTFERDKEILRPRIDETVFIAAGARIFGDVVVGKESSIWFNAVLRGDEGAIVIGEGTNIQDNAVIHSDMNHPARIGNNVSIGHGAVIRGCTIGDGVMVGMNATVMTYVEIGEGSIVGAQTFIPYHKTFPPRSLILGSPARLVRELREDELEMNRFATRIYLELAARYGSGKITGHDG